MSSISVNWPTAALLMTALVCFTVLGLGRIIDADTVKNVVIFLSGVAVPSGVLATRTKTVYSQYPPPIEVEHD